MKKLLSIIIVAAMLAAALSIVTVHAQTRKIGLIQNVKISKQGRITFDAYEGAKNYFFAIDIYSTGIDSGDWLTSQITENGEYHVRLDAIDKNEEYVADWSAVIKYEDTEFTVLTSDYDEDDPYVLPGSTKAGAAIKNISFYKSGKLVWDDVEGAEKYVLDINGYTAYKKIGKRIDFEYSLKEGENNIIIDARNAYGEIIAKYDFILIKKGDRVIAKDVLAGGETETEIPVTGAATEAGTGAGKTDKETDKAVETGTEPEELDHYYAGGGIIIIICIILAAIAVTVTIVIIVLIVVFTAKNKKKKK